MTIFSEYIIVFLLHRVIYFQHFNFLLTSSSHWKLLHEFDQNYFAVYIYLHSSNFFVVVLKYVWSHHVLAVVVFLCLLFLICNLSVFFVIFKFFFQLIFLLLFVNLSLLLFLFFFFTFFWSFLIFVIFLFFFLNLFAFPILTFQFGGRKCQ